MGRSAVTTVAVGLGIGAIGVLAALRVRDERFVQHIWDTLDQPQESGGIFSETMVADLPDAARRYFLYAIQPGTPLATRLHWHYIAEIRPGENLPMMPLEVEQILVSRRGFVWKARAQKGPLVITARDHYLDGEGRMRIALFGLIPIINATGPDLSKSAMGRLVIEGVALPSSLLPGPDVEIAGIDDMSFTVSTHLHGETTPVTITVDPEGRPTEVTMPRWGNLTADGSYQHLPYGLAVSGEQTIGGYTIPAQVAGGWWYGTERYAEDIRLRVDWARLS